MQLTSEYFESAGITIHQPKSAHRYGEESLRLAEFCDVLPGMTVVDLCSGCGVIGLIIHARCKPRKTYLVEIQRPLCDVAKKNCSENGFGDEAVLVNADYRDFAKANLKIANYAFSNPPFRKRGSGRLSPNSMKSTARHEGDAGIDDLFRATSSILVKGGRFSIVFPVERESEADASAMSNSFQLSRDGGLCCGDKFFLREYRLCCG